MARVIPLLWSCLVLVTGSSVMAADAKHDSPHATIETGAELENLIKHAQQAIERGDWKLAVDSLQRILDHPTGGLVPAPSESKSPQRFESTHQLAQRILAQLDSQGLAAYRLLYDGQAKASLAEAIERHDPAALAKLVDRFLLTSCGDNAASVLASWQLDQGDAAESLVLLDQIQTYCHDHDVPAGSIAARKAVAYALLGQAEQARQWAAQSGDQLGDQAEQLDGTIATLVRQSQALEPPTVEPGHEFWPSYAGGQDRRGLMPTVVPTISSRLPWRFELPEAIHQDQQVCTGRPGSRVAPPAFFPVVAQGRLFIKGLGRCAALDLESFEPLWMTPATAAGDLGQEPLSWPVDRHVRRVEFDRYDLLCYDFVAASLTVTDRLLLSIERPRPSTLASTARGTSEWQTGQPMSIGSGQGTQLLAYDVQTGQFRWQLGGANADDDSQLPLELMASPLQVNGQLWVPAYRGGQLVVLMVNADSGQVLRTIELCNISYDRQRPGPSPYEALWPAVASQTVYVPTNQGLLFAIDTRTAQPIWATRYRRSKVTRNIASSLEPAYWLSGPPVVHGSLVWLAPADSPSLWAFDRITGEQRYQLVVPDWTLGRTTNRHIIAADGNKLWLAGPQVRCVSTETGKWLWQTERVFEPTGRAVLSGSTIYIPTASALVGLDANTGEVVSEIETEPDQPWLGNLLALPDCLISVNACQVCKYPDLQRAYERLKESYQADPSNPVIALRLAWLELLRDAPQEALDLLKQLSRQASPDQPNRQSLIAHLTCEALIGLASQPDLAPEPALDYLQQAVQAAIDDEDRLRTGILLGLHLANAERIMDSYQGLAALARSPAAEQTVEVGRGRQRRARLMIAEQLAALVRQMPAEQRERITLEEHNQVTQAVTALNQTPDQPVALDQLEALADTAVAGAAQAARHALGRWQAATCHLEAAEQNLLAVIHGAADPGTTAAARLDLAKLYLRDDQQLLTAAAEQLAWLVDHAQDESVIKEARQLQTDLDAEALADQQATLAPERFEPQSQPAWSNATQPLHGRLLQLRGLRPPALSHRLLIAVAEQGQDRIDAHDVGDGRVLWQAPLELLDRPTWPTATGDDDPYSQALAQGPRLMHAVADGQTLLVRTTTGLHAVGLVTGKRLWAVAIDDNGPDEGQAFRTDQLDTAAGKVVYATAAGRVVMRRVSDGVMLWQLAGSLGLPVRQLRLSSQRVLAANLANGQLVFLSAVTGQPIGELRVQVPEVHRGLGVAWFEPLGIFCSVEQADPPVVPPERGDGSEPGGLVLVAHGFDDGQVRWQQPLDTTAVALLDVAADAVAVVTDDEQLRLFHVSDGTTIITHRLVDRDRQVADARLHSGLLVLVSTTLESAPRLTAIDIASGEVRWRRTDLALPNGPLPSWSLRAAESVIIAWLTDPPQSEQYVAKNVGPTPVAPDLSQARVVVRDLDQGDKADQAKLVLALAALDWQTGEPLGPPIVLDAAAVQHLAAVAVWPHRLFVQSLDRVFDLATKPVEGSDK